MKPKQVLILLFFQFSGLARAFQPGEVSTQLPADSPAELHAIPFARQTTGQPPPPSAPGEVVAAAVPSPVRIPIFLIRTADSPPGDWNAPEFTSRLDALLFEERPGAPSLGNYVSACFGGSLRFPHRQDVIRVTLPKELSRYYSNGSPNLTFLNDLKAFVETDVENDLQIYDNVRANPSDLKIDLAVFLFYTGDSTARAMRSWTEWTTENGWGAPRDASSLSNTLKIRSKGMVKEIKLSSFCCGRLFVPDGSDFRSHGWLAHEMFHCFGLPDLYDAENGAASAGCGSACSMSWGMFGLVSTTSALPLKDNPVLPSAWCRAFLNRNSAIPTPHENLRFLPPPAGKPPFEGVVHLTPAGSDIRSFARFEMRTKEKRDHYILVELRAKRPASTGAAGRDWDEAFKEGGFLIWEVDESVGRKIGSKENGFWPMGRVQQTGPGWENSDDNHPLVCLRIPSDTGPPRNLPLQLPWMQDYIWKSDSMFERENVKLSNFNADAGTFSWQIGSAGVSVPATEPTSTAPGAMAAPDEVAEIDPRKPVKVLDAEGSELPNLVSPGLLDQTEAAFKFYPGFSDFAVREKEGEEASLTMPISEKSFSSTRRQIIKQLDSLKIKKESGRNPNHVFTKITSDDLDKLASRKTAEIRDGFYMLLDGKQVKIEGSSVVIQRDKHSADRLRYEFTTDTSMKEALETAKTRIAAPNTQIASREQFQDLVEKRYKDYLQKIREAGGQPEWELITDPGGDSIRWQCRISNGTGALPWIIEADAVITGGNFADDAPLKIK